MSKKEKEQAKTEEEVKEPEAQTTQQEEVKKAPSAEEQLAAALALAEDFKRKWIAVTAEYENYRKRNAATASQKYNEGRADVVEKIFPIGDNIERALAMCTDEKMKQGLQMVKASFEKTLQEEGIEAIDPTGTEFDPYIANAVMAQPAGEGETAGMVKQTFMKGYKKGDKVLRFAQVVVTQ